MCVWNYLKNRNAKTVPISASIMFIGTERSIAQFPAGIVCGQD